MTLTINVVEVASWTTVTTPKAITVPACNSGDWLFCLAGGDQDPGLVTAAAVTTTAGSTSAWTEVAKILTGASGDWMLLSRASVTGAGDVTASISRTAGTGSPGEFGGYVIRAQGSSGIGNFATDFTQGTQQVVSLVVSGSASTVGFLNCDWNAAGIGTTWTPATDVTLVERRNSSLITYHAAYWQGQTAGTRNYGSVGAGGSNFRCIAVEILDAGGGGGGGGGGTPFIIR